VSSLSEETDRFVYQTKRTPWTARLVDEAVSARASRASRFAPWKNAASAEAFRSRRRLPYVGTTAGIGSASGCVRTSRDESAAPSLAALRQHFSALCVTALKVGSTRPGRHGSGLRDATSLAAIDVRAAVNRGATAARRILPTLSGAFQDAAKRPAAVPCGGGVVSPPPVERPDGPTDSGCRANHLSRRRQRQHSPRRGVLPRREAGGRSR
jgi:hypothetical protein